MQLTMMGSYVTRKDRWPVFLLEYWTADAEKAMYSCATDHSWRAHIALPNGKVMTQWYNNFGQWSSRHKSDVDLVETPR